MSKKRIIYVYERLTEQVEKVATLDEASLLIDRSRSTLSRHLNRTGFYVNLSHVVCLASFFKEKKLSPQELIEEWDKLNRRPLHGVKVTEINTGIVRRYKSFTEAVKDTRKRGGTLNPQASTYINDGYIVSRTHVLQLRDDTRDVKSLIAKSPVSSRPRVCMANKPCYVKDKDGVIHTARSIAHACEIALPKVSIRMEMERIRRTLKRTGYVSDPYYKFEMSFDRSRLTSSAA